MEFDEEAVDINTASVDEFVTRLKGVGRSKARAIVRFRTTVGKFKKLCELTDVPGITQCILERNQGVLLCVSSRASEIKALHELSDDEPLEEGDLSVSELMLAGESERNDNIELNGQHQVTWGRRNLSRSLSLEFLSGGNNHTSNNKDIGEDVNIQSLETPSTSIQHLDDDSEYCSQDTPIMRSIRSRSRSKNEERTFSMSTRSNPATTPPITNRSKAGSVSLGSPDSVGTAVGALSLSSQAGPSRITRGQSSRSRRTNPITIDKTERINTRRRGELTRSVGIATPDQSSERDSGQEDDNISQSSGMEMDYTDNLKSAESGDSSHRGSSKHLSITSAEKLTRKPDKTKRKRTRVKDDLYSQQQMKRKLDNRLDLSHHLNQSPEKKACKTSSLARKLLSPGSPRRFSTELSLSPSLNVLKLPPTNVEGLSDWLTKFQKWTASDRITAIDQLIDVCEPRQVRHMLEVIEPQFQRDFISLLPKELGLHVLSFLEPKDLLVAAQTCRYWHILTEDNLLWREKCAEEGIPEPYYPKVCKSSWKARKSNGLIGNPMQPSAWKAAFMRQHQIEMNWRNGEFKSAKHLKGHDDHVITCLQFSGTRIVSGSDDNTLKVWSVVSGKCLRTLTGHTGGVWASQMRKNMIISGSTDRTLKIWNADTGNCVHTLYGHTSTVRCMALHDNIVVSGSRDATLRVWDVDTGECLHVLSGHMAAVRCVCYDGKLVVSGAYDYNVKVWDPIREECLHTLQGHTNRVYSLQFDGVHVVSGSLDTSIRVWSVETGICLHTLIGHQSLTSGMELKNNILVSGNADSTVKMWDIVSGKCLKTLEGANKHQSAVTCLQFYGKFVISSSDDGTVKLWDVKSGKAIRDLVSLDSRGSGGVVWRIRASPTKLVCAVGSRNGTEETKLLVLDFDPDSKS
ncbi:F-box/WD repeat-containing protein 7-like isoform X2 [Styela clava]